MDNSIVIHPTDTTIESESQCEADVSCGCVRNYSSVVVITRPKYKKSNSNPVLRRSASTVTLRLNKSANNVFDVSTREGLRFAYDKALKREARSMNELSEIHTELEGTREMYRYADDIGQRLEQEVQELNAQLRQQLDLNSWFQKKNNDLENRNIMLMGSLKQLEEAEQQTRSELAEVIRTSYRTKAELNRQKQINSHIQKDHLDIRRGVQDLAGKYKREVEIERSVRLKAEEEYLLADIKLVDTEASLRSAREKIKTLEIQLQENEDMYSRTLVGLSSEKASLEEEYEKLFRAFTEVETGEKVNLNDPTAQRVSVAGSCVAQETLEAQIQLVEEDGDDIWSRDEIWSPVSYNVRRESSYRVKSEAEAIVQRKPNHDTFREYLHITVIAVKLHYPDLMDDITSEELIEIVETSPFYLWYDLMTHYMRMEEQRKKCLLEEERANRIKTKITEQTDSVRSEKQSWICGVFNRMKKKKPCSHISPTLKVQRKSDLRRSKILTNEFGRTSKVCTVRRTSKVGIVLSGKNQFLSPECEKKDESKSNATVIKR